MVSDLLTGLLLTAGLVLILVVMEYGLRPEIKMDDLIGGVS